MRHSQFVCILDYINLWDESRHADNLGVNMRVDQCLERRGVLLRAKTAIFCGFQSIDSIQIEVSIKKGGTPPRNQYWWGFSSEKLLFAVKTVQNTSRLHHIFKKKPLILELSQSFPLPKGTNC